MKAVSVDEGTTLKRWMPKAHGRATVIRKRSSHINLVLDEIKPQKRAPVKKKKEKEKEKISATSLSEAVKIEHNLKKVKNDTGKKSGNTEIDEKEEVFDTRMMGKKRHNQHRDAKDKKQAGGIKKKSYSKQKEG